MMAAVNPNNPPKQYLLIEPIYSRTQGLMGRYVWGAASRRKDHCACEPGRCCGGGH
jgi:hypothetical protein